MPETSRAVTLARDSRAVTLARVSRAVTLARDRPTLAPASSQTTMKHSTQRNQADEEVEKIKWALKLSGLDYFMEESPFRVSIHVKKSYIQDFSPKLSADLPWSPNLNSTSQATENDSGLPIQESSLCSSCHDKEKEIEDVRREVVKVLVDSNENNDKLEMAKLKLAEYNENLKKVQNETNDLKNEIKTKAEQLKQKNKKLESINSKLEDSDF